MPLSAISYESQLVYVAITLPHLIMQPHHFAIAYLCVYPFNEMISVLLNDVNDSRMPHPFFVHVHAIMELQRSSIIGKLYSQTK